MLETIKAEFPNLTWSVTTLERNNYTVTTIESTTKYITIRFMSNSFKVSSELIIQDVDNIFSNNLRCRSLSYYDEVDADDKDIKLLIQRTRSRIFELEVYMTRVVQQLRNL